MMIGTLVVLLAISAILLFALRSLRLGLISIVPNLVPAVMGLGVWGLAVGQVGLSLSVVVAMTVGIVVDDTVHFLAKYRRARLEYGRDPEDAVRYAFDTAGRALFTTTVVLVAGFLIFAFSPFVPTAQVGVLTAMIIAFALVADLTLLPALLTAVDRRPRRAGRVCALIRTAGPKTASAASPRPMRAEPEYPALRGLDVATRRCYVASQVGFACYFGRRRFAVRSGDEMLQQIVEKSALDADFRQQLLADPKSTICDELGITIPDSMNIMVHESDMQTVHLALPPDPNITEEQLEAISAGLCCCW